jgi:hypothetical protein
MAWPGHMLLISRNHPSVSELVYFWYKSESNAPLMVGCVSSAVSEDILTVLEGNVVERKRENIEKVMKMFV